MTRRWVLLGAMLVGFSACKPASKGLKGNLVGAGATLPEPLYSRWIAEFAGIERDLKIEYRATGSSAGIQSLMENTVDFGASDTPMSDDQMSAGGKVVHVPTTLGCIAIAFHLADGPEDLKMTPDVLASIYLGEITRWNDPKMVAINPGAKLPDKRIGPVYRTDGSGTTKVFSNYLSAQSAAWKDKYGTKAQLQLPHGLGAAKSDGVARLISTTDGALGYVELSFAKAQMLNVFSLKNSAGKFVTPSLDGMTAAAEDAQIPEDLRVTVLESNKKDAYPITTFSYVVFYEGEKDPTKLAALKGFLWWATHDGQKYGPILGYGTLPPSMVARIEPKLK